jgi:hypothetical protein
VENRILIIGDELMGEQGEAANHAAELILCREANLPIQFYINAPAPQSIPLFLARMASDIIGKKAGRLVMGLGLRELRRAGGNGEAVAKTYGALVERLVNKTQGRLNFLTIPEDMFPEARFEVAYLNDAVRGFAGLAPQKVSVWDFAQHAAEFKEKQAERGKFARSLYNEDGSSTSLGNMLMALFLQECILREVKRG